MGDVLLGSRRQWVHETGCNLHSCSWQEQGIKHSKWESSRYPKGGTKQKYSLHENQNFIFSFLPIIWNCNFLATLRFTFRIYIDKSLSTTKCGQQGMAQTQKWSRRSKNPVIIIILVLGENEVDQKFLKNSTLCETFPSPSRFAFLSVFLDGLGLGSSVCFIVVRYHVMLSIPSLLYGILPPNSEHHFMGLGISRNQS